MFILLVMFAAVLGFTPAGAAEKSPPEAAAMPVRFSEGVVHGFLVLSTLEGVTIAQGELLQVAREDEVTGRMIFRFKDGSISEETTAFTQHGVFLLKSYHQVQRGPAFPKDLDYKIERVSAKSGKYQATTKNHEDGKVEKYEDTFDMPADLYNGLVIAVAKNIPEGGRRTIHVLGLTPKPRLIEVKVHPVGTQKVAYGAFQENAIHYALDPDLGAVLGTLAKVVGKDPPDQNLWVASGEAPGFVRFEGSLYPEGPVWRISLGSPCLPAASEPCPATR